ncbi:CASP-like protein 4A3 [Miscanthus floridulus]|uniref:CASP-like protein 4A3 n=1 Tax=Miscanthus floridulus TaxID=154761 RepID=UPI003458519D
MASPTRTPPPPPAVEPIAPSSPSSEHPPVKPSSDGSLSPENPAPAPPPPPATPPPHTPGDSSPSSTPHPSAPQPPPPPPPPPPLPPSADASPPLPRQGQTSPPRPLPRPSPAPVSPPTPAPASSEAKSEQEAAESATESGSMTLAVVLAQTEDSTPRKASSAEASPAGSPQKESAVTIAKLLSGEDPAATEAKATPDKDKVTPPSDTGSLAAAAAVTAVGGVGGGVGSKRWLLGGVPEKVRRAELRRAELGFRVSAAVFCLVALSVMAADTTTGWSGDSFRRYNEYRYVLAASVMAFTYSGFQLVAEVHYLVTGRRMIRAPFRSYFNLAMDQMLAYLLLSASSAALSRNGVWMSRFGGDQFTKLINASASMAFLAFIALGLNSVISAYCVFSLVS